MDLRLNSPVIRFLPSPETARCIVNIQKPGDEPLLSSFGLHYQSEAGAGREGKCSSVFLSFLAHTHCLSSGKRYFFILNI